MTALIKKYYPIFLLILFCSWQLRSLLVPAWPRSHDGIYHVIRIKEYYSELKNGQFPVRWTDNLDNHFGLPLFNYVYPGPYILGLIPMWLGLNELTTYKILMFFGFLMGTVGFYLIFSNKNNFFALITALLFALTPYWYLDIFVRGALGEVLAIGFMPWVLYGFAHNKKFISILALIGIIICHNFIGILFLLFLIVKLIWGNKIKLEAIQNILIALGISAFFLIPLIAEKGLITSGLNNNFTFDYREHFVYPTQLIYGKWDYWYSNPGSIDGMSFQIGLANVLTILLMTISLLFIKNKKKIIFLLLSTYFTLFLTTNYSLFVWKLITPLQVIQFPWRLLFMPLILCPLLFWELINHIPKNKNWLKYCLSFFLLTLAFVNVRNYLRPMEYVSFSKYQLMIIDEKNKTTTSARSEVSPKWSTISKENGGKVINSITKIEIPTVAKSKSIKFTITDKTDITILKNYFPGWKLINTLNNQEMQIQPDTNGNVKAQVVEGRYEYRYGQTNIEKIANFITFTTLGLLIVFSVIFKT